MDTNTKSICIYIPAEFYDKFIQIVNTGLKSCKIEPNQKKQIRDWWNVEKEMIADEK